MNKKQLVWVKYICKRNIKIFPVSSSLSVKVKKIKDAHNRQKKGGNIEKSGYFQTTP